MAEAADEVWDRGGLTAEERESLLGRLDDSFEAVFFARYGGAVHMVLARGGMFKPDEVLRVAGNGRPGALRLEIHLRGEGPTGSPPEPGQAAGTMAISIGTISLADDPEAGLDDVHVLTEIFDEYDPNGHAEVLPSHEGLGLSAPDPFAAGQMPGRGLVVVRPTPGDPPPAGRRGWQPAGERIRTSRGGGLGNNGHARSPVSAVPRATAATLLSVFGKALSGTTPFDRAVDRVVLSVDG